MVNLTKMASKWQKFRGGYYQEVQDVLVEVLEGAKWLIDCYVAKPERYKEYQDVVKAIRKARGEE